MVEHGVVTPYEGTAARSWDDATEIDAPLRLHEATVGAQWVDYNRHLTESAYLLVFGDGADAFFRYLGIDERYRADGGSLYTVQTHLHHRREAAEGEPLAVSLLLLGHDAKRVHVFQEMRHGTTGALLASAEQLLVHVDTAAGRSAPLPEWLRSRLAAIRRAHAVVPVPDAVGVPIVPPADS